MILLRLLIGTQHCRGSKLLKLNNGMVSVDDEGGTHEGKDHSGAESLRVHHELRALRLHRHLEHEQQGTYTCIYIIVTTRSIVSPLDDDDARPSRSQWCDVSN
jgi:hypothetical protein